MICLHPWVSSENIHQSFPGLFFIYWHCYILYRGILLSFHETKSSFSFFTSSPLNIFIVSMRCTFLSWSWLMSDYWVKFDYLNLILTIILHFPFTWDGYISYGWPNSNGVENNYKKLKQKIHWEKYYVHLNHVLTNIFIE